MPEQNSVLGNQTKFARIELFKLGLGTLRMRNGRFTGRTMSRRNILKTSLAGVSSLVPAIALLPQTAEATNQRAEMNPPELIRALRIVGKPVCVKAADKIAASLDTNSEFDLHLRSAGLVKADARILASGIKHSNTKNVLLLKSFSASFNPELGDAAAALAEVFPDSVTELGLVGCSIGDEGGKAILKWAQTAPNLRMICVEGNNFSAEVRAQFNSLASHARRLVVVV